MGDVVGGQLLWCWHAGMMLGNAISGVSVGLTALLEEFAVGKQLLTATPPANLRMLGKVPTAWAYLPA